MGSKYIVPYGLYRVEGFVSANLAHARRPAFPRRISNLLWQAILNMFENLTAAPRAARWRTRSLIVFKHESEFGNAPAWKLFERVQRCSAGKA